MRQPRVDCEEKRVTKRVTHGSATASTNVATRYGKTASSFAGVLCLAATLDWLKP